MLLDVLRCYNKQNRSITLHLFPLGCLHLSSLWYTSWEKHRGQPTCLPGVIHIAFKSSLSKHTCMSSESVTKRGRGPRRFYFGWVVAQLAVVEWVRECEPQGADHNWLLCLCSCRPPAAAESESPCCSGFHQGLLEFVLKTHRCVTTKGSSF